MLPITLRKLPVQELRRMSRYYEMVKGITAAGGVVIEGEDPRGDNGAA